MRKGKVKEYDEWLKLGAMFKIALDVMSELCTYNNGFVNKNGEDGSLKIWDAKKKIDNYRCTLEDTMYEDLALGVGNSMGTEVFYSGFCPDSKNEQHKKQLEYANEFMELIYDKYIRKTKDES